MLIIKSLLKTKGATEAALRSLKEFYHGKITVANGMNLEADVDLDNSLDAAKEGEVALQERAKQFRLSEEKAAYDKRAAKSVAYDATVKVNLGKLQMIDAAL